MAGAFLLSKFVGKKAPLPQRIFVRRMPLERGMLERRSTGVLERSIEEMDCDELLAELHELEGDKSSLTTWRRSQLEEALHEKGCIR